MARLTSALLLTLLVGPVPRAGGDAVPAARSRWRDPVALWLAPDGGPLYAACQKSGTVLVIDVDAGAVIDEIAVGRSPVALAGSRGGSMLLACDAGLNELVVLERVGSSLNVQRRVPVPARPTSVVAAPDGRSCFVASSWARRLSRIALDTGRITATIELEFAPGQAAFLADGRTLVVADAFGGRLGLVDSETGQVLRVAPVPGHNIRGLAVARDGRSLLLSQMILTESAATTRDNVFWGIAMSSNLRIIPVAALFDERKNPVREAQTHFFGDPGHAAGDPGATVALDDGTILVCLSGVGEVAIGRYAPYGFRRLAVGRHPCAIAVSDDQTRAFVANGHSDTISVLDVPGVASAGEIRLGSPAGLSETGGAAPLAERGERLFYDARLSLDGWFSCSSCHSSGHTNGQNADTFGDGSYGAPKNVLSLLGAGSTGPWAWNGSKATLEDQVRDSLRTTMQPKSPPDEDRVAALAAYIRTLEPPPRAEPRPELAAAIARGERLFADYGCASCHTPPSYSGDRVYDVGLDDGEGGNARFNPPALRGIVHGAPYLHDGRARTLESVFREFRHKVPADAPDADVADLIAFLRSL